MKSSNINWWPDFSTALKFHRAPLTGIFTFATISKLGRSCRLQAATFDIVHSVHCSHGCQGQTVTCLTNFNENAAKCNICKMVVACKRGYIQQPHEMLTNTTLYKCEAVAKRLLQLLLCARCSLLALMLISQTKNLTIDPHVKVILVILIKISL